MCQALGVGKSLPSKGGETVWRQGSESGRKLGLMRPEFESGFSHRLLCDPAQISLVSGPQFPQA